ncbi:hypothetical protein PG988_001875 [Apiospora saccharicola]
MGVELSRSPKQEAEFVVNLVLTPIGIVVTILRFVATSHSSRNPGLEDWMAISGTLFFVLTNLGSLSAIGILNGRDMAMEILEAPDSYGHIRKNIDPCVLVLAVAACVLQAFQCRPMATYWDPSVTGQCTQPGPVALIGETPNSLIDVAMVSLAIVMIRSLQLPRSTKLKL